MSTFQCKMCGGSLDVTAGATLVKCDYCGCVNTVSDCTEKVKNMYNWANDFRTKGEFDKASGVYEAILFEAPNDPEAYWGLALCRYGIQYVEDPISHRRMPTVGRASKVTIDKDDNFRWAYAKADEATRVEYERQAREIYNIQKEIIAASNKEAPYDVFISYKETDDSTGQKTLDSTYAQELYYELEKKGFRAFYAPKSLKPGTLFEPVIFAALNSARVMIVLGTKPEYFDAVWVKNEWKRYFDLIKQGEDKILVPAFRNMNPYDLPTELSDLNAKDMSEISFMQSIFGIIENKSASKKESAGSASASGMATAESLLKRAQIYLHDADFEKADEYFDRVLDANPEESRAYWGRILAKNSCHSDDELSCLRVDISHDSDFVNAMNYATADEKEKYDDVYRAIRTNIYEYNMKILDAARERFSDAKKEYAYANEQINLEIKKSDEIMRDVDNISKKFNSIKTIRKFVRIGIVLSIIGSSTLAIVLKDTDFATAMLGFAIFIWFIGAMSFGIIKEVYFKEYAKLQNQMEVLQQRIIQIEYNTQTLEQEAESHKAKIASIEDEIDTYSKLIEKHMPT